MNLWRRLELELLQSMENRRLGIRAIARLSTAVHELLNKVSGNR